MEGISKYRVRRFGAHEMKMTEPRKALKPLSHVCFKSSVMSVLRGCGLLQIGLWKAKLPSDMYFGFFSTSWHASHRVQHEFT